MFVKGLYQQCKEMYEFEQFASNLGYGWAVNDTELDLTIVALMGLSREKGRAKNG